MKADARTLFPGGGEAGALLRSFDWATTSLGPVESWSASLKALTRAVLHARQPMMLWWGKDLVQIYNDGFLPILGQKHPEAMGKPGRETWAEVWPVVGAQLEAVVTKGTPSWFEDVLVPIYRNGKLEDAWWIYNYSPAFDDDGSIAGLIIVCTETTSAVTARRQLEQASRDAELAREELHGVFMQAPQPIAILTGPDHRYTLANRAYDALVGRSVLGMPIAEAFSDAEAGAYIPLLDQVYRTSEPLFIREALLQLPDADGVIADRYIDVSYHPYHSPDLTRRGVMALINEVTHSVVARKQLEVAQRERAELLAREQTMRVAAESGERARDEFLAMLGHELRNPLAPIVTATQLMGLHGDHYERERQIIERQVVHLSRLVDDLLDVSRIARGQIELRRRPLELAEVTAKAVEMASPLFEDSAHRLTIDVPRVGLVVDGDPVRLAQVIGNLLNNAAKYTPPHGLIELRAARHGDQVTIVVSDSGPGLSDELLPRVFDLFVQGAQPLDRSQGGLGLGLALVKNLVGLHGGTVSARNRASGGSEFEVTLPLSSLPAHPLQADRASSRPRTAASSRRILVVDDNEDAAELLAALLRRIGHEVVVAHDAPSALEVLQAFRAEFGLLDLGLPGMDGYELADHIRKDGATSDVRLIAVTGYGQDNDRARTRDAGFAAHLTKPIPFNELVQILES